MLVSAVTCIERVPTRAAWLTRADAACSNFTSEFAASFNSWHMWATNFTQDLLSKTTGGPVIQGPLASMNNATAWMANNGPGTGCQQQPVRARSVPPPVRVGQFPV